MTDSGDAMTTAPTTIAPYGTWPSTISAERVAAGATPMSGLQLGGADGNDIFWLAGRAAEAGRNTLLRHHGADSRELTPAPFNVRTRVHEYGGGAYVVDGDIAYFSHFADNRLYRLDAAADDAAPVALSQGGQHRFADFVVDRANSRLIGVRELHGKDGEDGHDAHPQPVNTISAVAFDGVETVLVQGADFYSSPRLSPDGSALAWLSWDHPRMPWQGTTLWRADLQADGAPGTPVRVAGGEEESVCQPEWSPAGVLHFVSDRSGWWNLYRHGADGQIEALCPMAAEFASPHWTFGNAMYGFRSEHEIICTYIDKGVSRLARLLPASGKLEPISNPYEEIRELRVAPGYVAMLAGSPTIALELARIDFTEEGVEILAQSIEDLPDEANLSVPVNLSYPSANGRTAYAFFYPPRNRDVRAPDGDQPPGLRRARCELRRQHRLWPRLPRPAARPVGHRGRRGLRGRRARAGGARPGRRQTADHPGRQRGRPDHLVRIDVPRRVQAGRQLLRRVRPERAGPGFAQVRIALQCVPDRAAAAGRGAVPGPLAHQPHRPPDPPDDFLPGPGRQGGAAAAVRNDGASAARARRAGGVCAARGRRPWLPQGREHRAHFGSGTVFLPAHVRPARRGRAGAAFYRAHAGRRAAKAGPPGLYQRGGGTWSRVQSQAALARHPRGHRYPCAGRPVRRLHGTGAAAPDLGRVRAAQLPRRHGAVAHGPPARPGAAAGAAGPDVLPEQLRGGATAPAGGNLRPPVRAGHAGARASAAAGRYPGYPAGKRPVRAADRARHSRLLRAAPAAPPGGQRRYRPGAAPGAGRRCHPGRTARRRQAVPGAHGGPRQPAAGQHRGAAAGRQQRCAGRLRGGTQGAAARHGQAQGAVRRLRQLPATGRAAAQSRPQAPENGASLPRDRGTPATKPGHGRSPAARHAAPDPRRHHGRRRRGRARMGSEPAGADVPVPAVLLAVRAAAGRTQAATAGTVRPGRPRRLPVHRGAGGHAAGPPGQCRHGATGQRPARAPGAARPVHVVRAPGRLAAPAHSADQPAAARRRRPGRRGQGVAPGVAAGIPAALGHHGSDARRARHRGHHRGPPRLHVQRHGVRDQSPARRHRAGGPPAAVLGRRARHAGGAAGRRAGTADQEKRGQPGNPPQSPHPRRQLHGGGDQGDAHPAARDHHRRRAPPHRRHRRGCAQRTGPRRAAGAPCDQLHLVAGDGAVGHRRRRARHGAGGRGHAPARAPAAVPARPENADPARRMAAGPAGAVFAAADRTAGPAGGLHRDRLARGRKIPRHGQGGDQAGDGSAHPARTDAKKPGPLRGAGRKPLPGPDRGTAPPPARSIGLRRADGRRRAPAPAGVVRAGRTGRRRRWRESGQAVEGALGAHGGADHVRAGAAHHLAGRPARLPARWLQLAVAPRALGRPYPGDRAHVRVPELGERGGPLCAHAQRQDVRRGRPGRHAVDLAAVRPGGGQLRPAAAGGAAVCGRRDGLARRLPHGVHWHAAGKPPGRVMEPVPLHQSGPAGQHRAVQPALCRADRKAAGPPRHGGCAQPPAAADPAVHAAPDQVAGADGTAAAHRDHAGGGFVGAGDGAVRIAAPHGAGNAGGRGRPGGKEIDPDPGRDHEAAPRLLQPEPGGAGAGHRQQQAGRICAPAGRAAGKPPQGAGVQPVRGPPGPDPRAPGRQRYRLPVPRRVHAHGRAQEAGRCVPGRPGRRVFDQFKSGRRGHQPDGGRLRDPHGPVVEPGRGRPGVGPRPPHGPAAARHHLPAGGAPHDRGRHRRPAPAQARPGRQPARRQRRLGPPVGRRDAEHVAGGAGAIACNMRRASGPINDNLPRFDSARVRALSFLHKAAYDDQDKTCPGGSNGGPRLCPRQRGDPEKVRQHQEQQKHQQERRQKHQEKHGQQQPEHGNQDRGQGRAGLRAGRPLAGPPVRCTQQPVPQRPELAFIDEWTERFNKVNVKQLAAKQRTDLALLQNKLEGDRWRLTTLREYEWNPASYNVAGPLDMILNTEYAAQPQRLRTLLKRIASIPAYYEAARANIVNPTREHTRLAIKQAPGVQAVLVEVDKAAQASILNAAEKQQFTLRVNAALQAVDSYVAYLTEREKLMATEGRRSFRIGKQLYEKKFAYDIQSGSTAEQTYQKALAAREDLLANMDRLSDEMWDKYLPGVAKPADRFAKIGMMIDKLSERHVARENFVNEIKRQIPELQDWVIKHNLLTLDPNKQLEVRATPAYQAGVAGASIDAPGPYRPQDRTYYNVTPLDGATPEAAESSLREYNHWILQILNIHEAIPGHYAQLVYANKSPSIVKSIFGNGAMVEGWAVYGERMMLESGYGDNAPEMWLMYSKWNLRSVTNTILDYSVHVLGMTEEQAVDLLTRQAFQTRSEAVEKWHRVQVSSVQLTSYFSGYSEIMALREERKQALGDRFNLKQFHEHPRNVTIAGAFTINEAAATWPERGAAGSAPARQDAATTPWVCFYEAAATCPGRGAASQAVRQHGKTPQRRHGSVSMRPLQRAQGEARRRRQARRGVAGSAPARQDAATTPWVRFSGRLRLLFFGGGGNPHKHRRHQQAQLEQQAHWDGQREHRHRIGRGHDRRHHERTHHGIRADFLELGHGHQAHAHQDHHHHRHLERGAKGQAHRHHEIEAFFMRVQSGRHERPHLVQHPRQRHDNAQHHGDLHWHQERGRDAGGDHLGADRQRGNHRLGDEVVDLRGTGPDHQRQHHHRNPDRRLDQPVTQFDQLAAMALLVPAGHGGIAHHFLAAELARLARQVVGADRAVAQLFELDFARDFGFDVVQVALGAAVQGADHARHLGQFFRADNDQRHHADHRHFGKSEIDHKNEASARAAREGRSGLQLVLLFDVDVDGARRDRGGWRVGRGGRDRLVFVALDAILEALDGLADVGTHIAQFFGAEDQNHNHQQNYPIDSIRQGCMSCVCHAMVHLLPAIGPTVDDGLVAGHRLPLLIIADGAAEFPCQAGGQRQHFAQQRRIGSRAVGQRAEMLLGDHQQVHGGGRVDILESVQLVVLVHGGGGNVFFSDLAKQAVVHGGSNSSCAARAALAAGAFQNEQGEAQRRRQARRSAADSALARQGVATMPWSFLNALAAGAFQNEQGEAQRRRQCVSTARRCNDAMVIFKRSRRGRLSLRCPIRPPGAPVRRAPAAASGRTAPAAPAYGTTGRPLRTTPGRRRPRPARPWRPSRFRWLLRRSFSGWRRRPWQTAWRRTTLGAGRAVGIDFAGVLEDRLGVMPVAALGVALELLVEARVAARVAGDAAGLLDLEQHHVLVAVEADFQHFLRVARFLALVPQFFARAAPVHGFAQLDRFGQRVAVHPGEHQHVVTAGLLGDDRHQAVFVPVDFFQPFGLEAVAWGSRHEFFRGFHVEDAGRQHGVRLAQLDAVGQILQAAHAARSNHGDADGVRDTAGQAQVEAGLGAVAVHAGEQDFAGAQLFHFDGPFDGVDAGGLAPAVGKHFPLAGRHLLGVDGHHDALRAMLLRSVEHELRVRHGRRVHAHLVGARVEQAAHVGHLAHAAADGERYEHLRSNRLDDVQDQAAVVAGGGNVEERQFVGALLVVAAGDFHRVAGVAQLGEVDALDHAAIGHVQAGNDAFGKHGLIFRVVGQVAAEFVGAQLRRSQVDRAFVNRTAADHALDAFVLHRAQRFHVADVVQAARSDDGNLDRLRQLDGGLDIDAAHHAVAADVGVDDRFHAVRFEFFRQVDYLVAGHLAPAIGCHLAVLGVEPDDDMAGEGAARIVQEARFLDRGGADDDIADAGVEVALDGVEVADAAAQLHGNFIEVVFLGKLLHHFEDGLDRAFVFRLAGKGAVQVDQMQAARALLEPVQGHIGRVFRENGGKFHIALFEANAVTVFEVDGRNEQHDGGMKLGLRIPADEVAVQLQARRGALLRVELCGENIITGDGAAERRAIHGLAHGVRVLFRLRKIAVDEIKIAVVRNAVPHGVRRILMDLVPAHLRHLEARAILLQLAIELEAHHAARQQAQAGGVALLAAIEQHLLADAHAHQRLVAGCCQQRFLHAGLAQAAHAVGHGALAWQHDAVRALDIGHVARDQHIGEVLQSALGRRDGAGSARIELGRHAQRAAKGLEHGFALVVGVGAAQVVDVQGDQRMVDEAAEKLQRQVDVERADVRARKRDVVLDAWPAREVQHHARQRFVQRHVRVAVTDDALAVADGLGHGHAQRDAHVFHRVVVVDMDVARGFHFQVEQAVTGDLVEHMVEERHAGVQLLPAGAVEVDGDADLRLVGVAGDFCSAVHEGAREVTQAASDAPKASRKVAFSAGEFGVDIVGSGHAHQDKIRRRWKNLHARESGQCSRQIGACGAQCRRLLVQHRHVVEREFGRRLREHVDVVRRPHFVELREQLGRRRHVAEAYSGQSQLRHRAHHDQVVELRQAVHEGLLGERLVRFVHHGQAETVERLDDGNNIVGIEQVAGGVVRVRQEHDRRPVFFDGRQHGRQVEREVRLDRHADKIHARVLGRARVHHERRRGRQHHRAAVLLGAGHAQDRNQFVGPVAEHDVVPLGYAQRGADPLLGGVVRRHRIPVQGGGGQPVAQLAQQGLRQLVRVFHRIELHETTGVGHVVAMDGCHVGTDGVGDEGIDGRHLAGAPGSGCGAVVATAFFGAALFAALFAA
uniref:Uncharacterized protein n=1 Tax=Tanacetum cinerariifolium TaxID=118510 RepID=A0A699GEJ8_TANCI|nr:hypothetical protein [Tanacetum cinerariifolium]